MELPENLNGVDLSYVDPCIRHLCVPAADLKMDPKNANKHNKISIAKIRGSLKANGFCAPLIVDLDNVVLGGNGTLQAARELAWGYIPVVQVGKRGAAARALAIALNQTAKFAEFDRDILGVQLAEIQLELGDEVMVDLTGFALADATVIIGEAGGLQGGGEGKTVPEAFQIVIECKDEKDQQKVYERMTGEGYVCKVLTM